MSERQAERIKVGDIVMVGTLKATGTVIGIDTVPGCPGLKVRLHGLVNGVDNCYASHSECSIVTRARSPR